MKNYKANIMGYKRILVVIILFLLISIQLNAQKQMGPRHVIAYVAKESTAERMGLKSGDIILSINGQEIISNTSIGKQIKFSKGSEIEIKVLRKGKNVNFKSQFNTDKLGITTVFYEKDKLLSPKEMKEDLDTLFLAICEIHPNPYFNISKQEFDILKIKAYSKINSSMSVKDFWKLTAPIVANIGDGHTNLQTPSGEWFYQICSNRKIVFPLELHIIKDSTFVRKNFSDTPIKNGNYIVSINGIHTKKIIDDFIPYISGGLQHFKIAIIERYFPKMLYVIYGFKSPFKVEIMDSQGKIKKYTLEGVDKNTYDKMIVNLLDHNFHFEEIPELKASIIRFNNFLNRKKFDKFLENSFTKIKEKKYRYLIIDLRNNGGGNSDVAIDLLDYLINKPYQYFGGVREKISKYTLKYVQKDFKNKEFTIDSIYTFERIFIVKLSKNPLRFKGKIFVITSNYTFSEATCFAAVIKDYGVGTLIGEETGGIPTNYGYSCPVNLFNSHLTLNVSWWYLIRPNGDTTYTHRGIMPDIPVKTTAEDLHKNIDPVMKKVKEIIYKDLNKNR
jgi:C-terminal processing protease CtpA/Prc